MNLPPVNHSVSKDGLHPNNHNGPSPNVQSRSQGMIFITNWILISVVM